MIDDRNGDMMILKNVPNERLRFLKRATAKTKNAVILIKIFIFQF